MIRTCAAFVGSSPWAGSRLAGPGVCDGARHMAGCGRPEIHFDARVVMRAHVRLVRSCNLPLQFLPRDMLGLCACKKCAQQPYVLTCANDVLIACLGACSVCLLLNTSLRVGCQEGSSNSGLVLSTVRFDGPEVEGKSGEFGRSVVSSLVHIERAPPFGRKVRELREQRKQRQEAMREKDAPPHSCLPRFEQPCHLPRVLSQRIASFERGVGLGTTGGPALGDIWGPSQGSETLA